MKMKSAFTLGMLGAVALVSLHTEASPKLESIGRFRGVIPSSEVNAMGTIEVFSGEDFKETTLNSLEELRPLGVREQEPVPSESKNSLLASPKLLDFGNLEADVNIKHLVDNKSIQDDDGILTVPEMTRILSAESAKVGNFYSLDCNAELPNKNCNNLVSSLIPDSGTALTIPCGLCYTFDLGYDANVTLADGLNVEGKLVFPPNYKTNIFTPFVIVQGELEIVLNSQTVSPENEAIRFVLTGTQDIFFEPKHAPNQNACAEMEGSKCNIGKKAFFVAGGNLNIRGLPESCPTWTKLKKKIITKPPNPTLESYETFKSLPQGCSTFSSQETSFIDEKFKNGINPFWKGVYGTFLKHSTHQTDGAVVVSNRKVYWQGPLIDYTVAMPASCLLPNQHYLFTARIKLDKPKKLDDGTPTTCAINGTHCLQLISQTGDIPDRWRDGIWSSKATMLQKYAPSYGEYFYFTSTFTFSEDELLEDNIYWIMQIEGPEPGIEITLDDFKIDLPDQSSYPDEEDICKELILNGNAEGNGFNPYPMTHYHGGDRVEVYEENGNKFYRMRNRGYYWSSITSNINIGCLTQGVKYRASLETRIHTPSPQAYYLIFRLEIPRDSDPTDTYTRYQTILECPPQSLYDGTNGWVSCEGFFTIDEYMAQATSAKWALRTSTSPNNGVYDVDIDNLSIKFEEGYIEGFLVDNSVSPCWGPGSHVHATSAIMYGNNGYEGTIQGVEDWGDGNVLLRLDNAPVQPILSEEESSEFAVEVALLSRNVKIEGNSETTSSKEKSGGYLQVLHTVGLAQIIQGVEFRNMGSIGDADRFPIQLLYCGSVEGTLISKNTIRDSNQRAIVIDGTSNATISDNIGYEVSGHCFWVGPQSEQNIFVNNLASWLKRVDRSLRIPGESDNDASGFYSLYAPNNFVGNCVSAAYHGFYFYNLHYVRDEAGGDAGIMNARLLPMGTFKDNVAHSNYHSGMVAHYFEQASYITFENFQSYKNYYWGLYMYDGYRFILDSGFFAENKGGIFFRKAYDVKITNVDIWGLSDLTKHITSPPGYSHLAHCSHSSHRTMTGLKMPTLIDDDNEKEGITMENVRFSLFDNGEICDTSLPISFNHEEILDGHWSYLSSFNNVKFDDSRKISMDACAVGKLGVSDIVITDIDGSSDPYGKASNSASFVSNLNKMTNLAKGPCTHFAETCISYCQNTCLRTVKFAVDQDDTDSWVLKLQREEDGKKIYITGTIRYEDGDYALHESNLRHFSASLPMGIYTAEFLNENGELSWPTTVVETWEGAPKCEGSAYPGNVTVVEPIPESCDNLISNGDIESGTYLWHARGNYRIDVVPGGGIGGSQALISKRSNRYHGPSQNMDLRCIRREKVEFYEIKAWIRLEQDGENVSCDPSYNGLECPSMTFQFHTYDDDEMKDKISHHYESHKAKLQFPYQKDDFNLMHGIFRVTDKYLSAERILMYIERADDEIDIVVDNFSITPFDTSNVCNENLIRNGKFGNASSMYWRFWNRPYVELVEGYEGPEDFALKLSRKEDGADWSLNYDFKVSCLQSGERYIIEAKYKLMKQNDLFQCDPFVSSGEKRCNDIYYYSRHLNSPDYVRPRFETVVSVVHGDWKLISGIHTVNSLEEGIPHDHRIWFSGQDKSLDLIVDDISMVRVPLDCSNLVLNPSFEDGTSSFWKVDAKDSSKVELVGPGAASSSYALRNYDRSDSNRRSIYQVLDTRCFVEGQEYEITGKFKLLNGTDYSGLNCNVDDRRGNHICPSVRLLGYHCNGLNNNKALTFWNELQFFEWDPDDFNDFYADFIVTEEFSKCTEIRVYLGYSVNQDWDVVTDDFQIEAKTTFSPTRSPTETPTKGIEKYPTISPTVGTNAPTATVTACPGLGEDAIEINSGTTLLRLSGNNMLCTLTKITSDDVTGEVSTVVPVARSYNNNLWETAASSYAIHLFHGQSWTCYDAGCQINLPELGVGEVYRLSTYTNNLSKRDKIARFLESATFGITAFELNEFNYNDSHGDNLDNQMATWISNQMNSSHVGMTTHREYWRKRVNIKNPFPSRVSVPDHPCHAQSRWRKYTFARRDYIRGHDKKIRISGDSSGPYILSSNGHHLTVVDDLRIESIEYANYTFNVTHEYRLCNTPTFDEYIYIELEDETCQPVLNPPVNFTNYRNLPRYTIHLPNDQSLLQPIDEHITNGQEFMLLEGSNDVVCDDIPRVSEPGDPPIIGLLPDGSWLQFDPYVALEENTPQAPMIDGGGTNSFISGGVTYCSNVPRTFLNEDQCIVSSSSSACSVASSPETELLLNEDNILALFDLTGRYVYSVLGLSVVDKFNNRLPHPCTPGLRSRWELKPTSLCTPSNLHPQTNATLRELFRVNSDTNPYIRDINFPIVGMTCNETDFDPEIELIIDEKCYQRVHSEHMSVYDLTYWTEDDTHPGNAFAKVFGNDHPIKKWLDIDKSAFIIYPSSHPVDPGFDHPITRWDNHYHKFGFVGRFGDTIRVRDLPTELRQDKVSKYFGESRESSGTKVLVCGSPGEIASDKALGSIFEAPTGLDNFAYNPGENRKNVWTMTALEAKDQLRQRVAWALSQILVMVKSAIADEREHAEWFLNYYDIFVRHAFGNYRDILREISYNPLMAVNLSYLQSKSSAYMLKRFQVKTYADENFAREIMQLFTTGIIQLNMDGSPKLDSDGNTVLVYTNEDIMSFARAWTGFDNQADRGNIESGANRIDAMRIDPEWRDQFPKTDLIGGYIGDGYPLCVDFPEKMFLRKGARYRLLGESNLPELMSDPKEFSTDVTISKFKLDSDSELKNFLCNKGEDGVCQFANSFTLDKNLDCVGTECNVDTVRVVEINESIYYEYVQPACVQQAFYKNAMKLMPRYRYQEVTCGNPLLPIAAEACCQIGFNTAIRNAIYDGERMTFSLSEKRCAAISRETCDYYNVDSDANHKIGYQRFWTPDACLVRAKINPNGYIAIVYEPSDYTVKDLHVNNDSENWFRVYWEDAVYPIAANYCDNACEQLYDGSCLCETSVSTSRVFKNMPRSIEEALSNLHIGALNPEVYDTGTYTSTTTDIETGIIAHKVGDRFDANTVFELIDDFGRTRFLKNAKEVVHIVGQKGVYTGFSFRNAPHFMSLIDTEKTQRDAQYETEATLDHYFYHDNTAPFISIRLIQRFGISNPTPRYVKSVATSFREGTYQFNGNAFGAGKYGDLAATTAAILLDREARSVVLDADASYGSLREPILKVMGLMRSMEFKSLDNQPVIRLMDSLAVQIGQMAHEFPSVFSFFLPEFKPYGRVGDAFLVGPEASLLDMPKTVSILNGLFSMIKYGLSRCYSGFGSARGHCYEGNYDSSNGILQFNRTNTAPSGYFYDSFEGPSLVGAFDNQWVGYHFRQHAGLAVNDPLDSNNHALSFQEYAHHWIFSPEVDVDNDTEYVVKFRYYSANGSNGKGCIGFTELQAQWNRIRTWSFCDTAGGDNQMISNGEWITCQFAIPIKSSSLRVVIGGYISGDEADYTAYFDDIQVVPGTGTSCIDVSLEDFSPPGVLGYSSAVVDELATLLTAGRLNQENRQIIQQAFDNGGSADEGLRIAQQLIVTSPEFHSTNIVKKSSLPRKDNIVPEPSDKRYKAVVYIMFNGGCDSFNMLVPYSCRKGKDLYEEYHQVRQQVALTKERLLEISSDDQICESFGVHENLPTVQKLYNDQDLLFFANTGVLTKPVDKTNYNHFTATQLFAHNTMQQEAKRLDPLEERSNTGVIGRMSDHLTQNGHSVGSFSVDRYSVALVGYPGVSTHPLIINRNGISAFNENPSYPDMDGDVKAINQATTSDSGYFAETWSDILFNSFQTNELLRSSLETVEIQTEFPSTYLGQQLKIVAQLIAIREDRGVDTDTFYVEDFGYDTHSDVDEHLNIRFTGVDGAFAAFSTELKAMGMWENVVTIQTSDFARTLTPNGGDGTDHAWGGNYMMFGGGVKGGQIVGEYPDDLTDNGSLGLGRGRLIPTTPWDACFQAIAEWLGIAHDDLDTIFPNRHQFPPSQLFNASDLFLESSSKTDNPTQSPTDNPTESPTVSPTICKDDSEYKMWDGSMWRYCSWVADYPQARCGYGEFFYRCKISCGTCGVSNPYLTNFPTHHPSLLPSKAPSSSPSSFPTQHPSSQVPSSSPSSFPTQHPSSQIPSSSPSSFPTQLPSLNPTKAPVIIKPSADAYVRCCSFQSKRYGTWPYIKLDGNVNDHMFGIFKFNLKGVTGRKAVFRFMIKSIGRWGIRNVTVKRLKQNPWWENTVTYQNLNPVVHTVGNTVRVSPDMLMQWVEIDISEFLGISFLNFMLEAENLSNQKQAWLSLYSKNDPTYYPHIKVMD